MLFHNNFVIEARHSLLKGSPQPLPDISHITRWSFSRYEAQYLSACVAPMAQWPLVQSEPKLKLRKASEPCAVGDDKYQAAFICDTFSQETPKEMTDFQPTSLHDLDRLALNELKACVAFCFVLQLQGSSPFVRGVFSLCRGVLLSCPGVLLSCLGVLLPRWGVLLTVIRRTACLNIIFLGGHLTHADPCLCVIFSIFLTDNAQVSYRQHSKNRNATYQLLGWLFKANRSAQRHVFQCCSGCYALNCPKVTSALG